MGRRQVGPVGVGLHLAQGDGGLGHPSVGIADPVPAVLPSLVGQSSVGTPRVLHVAVSVGITELLDPLDGACGVGEEFVDHLTGHAPPPHLP